MRESSSSIDASAAAWVARLDRGLSAAERVALEAWLAADSRHVGSLARAQATWVHADRAKGLASPALVPQPGLVRRRAAWWVSAAAGIVALSGAGWVWQEYTRTHLSTAIGETREYQLEDGSRATLGAHSNVSLRYEHAMRGVRLESGNAVFKVAKDPTRPFVVQARNARVRAVGTEFEVRDGDRAVEVSVAEGAVNVWSELTPNQPPLRLTAGNRAFVTAGGISAPQQSTGAQVLQSTESTSGIIDFNGKTLGEAAAELNRYNRRTIIIANSALAERKIVGRFRATDPAAFVYAAAAMLDAHVRAEPDRFIIEPGRR